LIRVLIDMLNLFQKLPPVPIFVLSLLVLVWIVPLLFARIRDYMGHRGGELIDPKNGPKTAAAARRNFYRTFCFTAFWGILFLARGQRRSEEHVWMFLIVSFGIFMTFHHYRQWHRFEPKAGLDH